MGKRQKSGSNSRSSKLEKEPLNKKVKPTTSANQLSASQSQDEPLSQSSNQCTEVAVASEQATGDFTDAVRAFGNIMCMVSEKLTDMDCLLWKSSSNSKWEHNWDGMDGVETERKRFIYLIRHGQYNLNGAVDNDRHLTERGKEQAKLTGNRLRETNFQFTSLTSSSMTRALESSMEILRALRSFQVGFTIDCILREGFPCLPDLELTDKKRCGPEGSRIEEAFKKYFHRADEKQMDDSHEIIVCHANVIRYFICRAMQFQPEAWLRMVLSHASITQFEIHRDGVVIMSGVNGNSHLPQSMITYS